MRRLAPLPFFLPNLAALPALTLALASSLWVTEAWSQSHLWSRSFGDSEAQEAQCVAADGSGNVVIAGWIMGSADFGGGFLTSAGDRDIFVAKFDALGNHVWSRRFGNASAQQAAGVAVDGSGNVVLTGWFLGSVDFGGGSIASSGTAVFVAKFDPHGGHLWSLGLGGSAQGRSVTSDALGNVIVAGNYQGSIDFGGGELTSAGATDIFLLKLDSAGSHVWSRSFGDAAAEEPRGVACAGGKTVLTGWFRGGIDFGGGVLASAGSEDVFLAQFDANGAHLWSKRFGDSNAQEGSSVDVDAAGNVFVTGSFSGSLDFGGGFLSATDQDVFLAKFDPAGSHVWSHAYGSAGDQLGRSVAVDGAGDVVVGGVFLQSVDFGGGTLVSLGSFDVFLAKLGGGGAHLWSRRMGSTSLDDLRSVAAFSSGGVLATGGFHGTVDFGGGPLTASGEDIFLAAYGPAPTDAGSRPGPESFALYSLTRNPALDRAAVGFDLAVPARVRLSAYDAAGRMVRRIVRETVLDAGRHGAEWDLRDERGARVPPGLYYYRLETPRDSGALKIVVAR